MKKIKYILPFLILIVIFTSCEKDFLELRPEYAIDAETSLQDSVKLEAFVTGIYDTKTYWYYKGHIIMSSDARGGDVVVRNYANYGRFVSDYQYNITSTYYMPQRVWWYGYKMITAANLIINQVPDNDFDETYINEVVAEAKVLRATAYLNLLSFFSHTYSVNPDGLGVPVVVDPIGPDDDFPARGTVQEVYDLIISDLTFANSNLGDRNSGTIMRVNSNIVSGLLARAYLDMGDWGNASTYAQAARDGYPLAPAADLSLGFVDPTVEWMWANDHRDDDNNGYLLVASFYDPFDAGYSSFKASQEFVGLYEVTDERYLAYFGALESPADAYKVNKFLFRGDWALDQVLMRSAEMFLIEAEAEAELGNDPLAITALNAVQTRANTTLTVGLTGQALIDAVLLERRKELFGEGFASYDLQRRNLPLVRTSVGHWAPLTLPANSDLFLYPIPQDEIDANENIIQNNGY